MFHLHPGAGTGCLHPDASRRIGKGNMKGKAFGVTTGATRYAWKSRLQFILSEKQSISKNLCGVNQIDSSHAANCALLHAEVTPVLVDIKFVR